MPQPQREGERVIVTLAPAEGGGSAGPAQQYTQPLPLPPPTAPASLHFHRALQQQRGDPTALAPEQHIHVTAIAAATTRRCPCFLRCNVQVLLVGLMLLTAMLDMVTLDYYNLPQLEPVVQVVAALGILCVMCRTKTLFLLYMLWTVGFFIFFTYTGFSKLYENLESYSSTRIFIVFGHALLDALILGVSFHWVWLP